VNRHREVQGRERGKKREEDLGKEEHLSNRGGSKKRAVCRTEEKRGEGIGGQRNWKRERKSGRPAGKRALGGVSWDSVASEGRGWRKQAIDP